MSETYTIGGDSWADITHHVREGQTFTPRESHTLEYIDLAINQLLFPATIELEVYLCDISHHPTGPILSHSTYHLNFTWPWPGHFTLRFKMTPCPVLSTIEYAIIAYLHLPAVSNNISWLYDNGDASYPRGFRISKLGEFDPWNTEGSDDHIFAEFGTPPLPKPEPEPPIENFAIPFITYTHWDVGLVIRIPTTVPCHLTCYYTDKTPLKHHTSRVIRGLSVPWGTYFCFVAWQAVEQTEAGDTLYHTFHFNDWLQGQTKWFTFKGDIDLEPSPSIGPIFNHTHPGGLPRTLYLRPDAPGDKTEIFGQYPAPGAHWDKVNEVTPDDDARYVYEPFNRFRTDLYHLQNLPSGIEAIDAISVHIRARKTAMATSGAAPFMKTRGTEYSGGWSWWPNTNWHNRYKTWGYNPKTGKLWTRADITALQAGIRIGNSSYLGTQGRYTQGYVRVIRGIEGGPG